MDFLFQPRPARAVRVCAQDDGDDGSHALINGALARELLLAVNGSLGESECITVSLAPLHPLANGGDGNGVRSLVVRARLSPDVKGVVVPRSLHATYPDLFPHSHASASRNAPESSDAPTHSITPIRPVALSAVYLAAYNDADPAQLEDALTADDRVLRQGETLAFNLKDTRANGHVPSRETRLKVLACEPVMQGVARRGHTRFYLAATDDRDGRASPPPVSPAPSDASDAFEIDEHFLASSLVAPLARPRPYATSDSELSSSEDESAVLPARRRLAAATVEPVRPLSRPPWDAESEDERTMHVSPVVLGRVGVFSGDWAIVGSGDRERDRDRESPLDFRLVRLLSSSHSQHAVQASPTLISNLSSSSVPPTSLISLRATPFGSHAPPIPTARAVTVARVASPSSTDRRLQPLFLRALKRYFSSGKRLVKKGDLLAVGIDRTQASLIAEESEDSKGSPDVEEILSAVDSAAPTDAVFFKITNLEYDVADIPAGGGAADGYAAATMGELGVWLAADVTKMMQAGLEHARVPDVGIPSIPAAGGPLHDKLRGILGACLRPQAWEYQLHISVVMKGARGVGKTTLCRSVARALGMHVYEINCYDLLGESEAATEGALRARFERAAGCAPCVLLLQHLQALARNSQTLESGRDPLVVSALRACIEDLRTAWRASEFPVVLVGTTSEPDVLPPALLSCFKHEIIFEAPAEGQRFDILQSLLAKRTVAPDVSIPSLATQTAALVAGDLVDLVSRAELASISRALKDAAPQGVSEHDVLHAGIALTADDFEQALGKARAAYSESIGAPRIPNVTWDDVGGLANVKSEILDTIQLPLEHPELFADGLKKRSGILLYGPPGTGKTLLAKAVATSCSLNFFSVKGPELLNMYIGESEANVRRVFQRARDARPCVIFFDELDSVAPKRGVQGDSGGVMDRIVSQLLAELDGIAEGDGVGDVFVIGATNRPDLLDPALLRPGRFDRMLYLGISDTHDAQLRIMQALTRKFKLHPDLDLGRIAEQCPFSYTGADFYALCSDAMLKAMSRKAQEIDAKIAVLNQSPVGSHPFPMTPQYYLAELAKPEEISVLVGQQDFEDALRELVPSVSQGELEHYAAVQQRFANETIGSKKNKGKGRA